MSFITCLRGGTTARHRRGGHCLRDLKGILSRRRGIKPFHALGLAQHRHQAEHSRLQPSVHLLKRLGESSFALLTVSQRLVRSIAVQELARLARSHPDQVTHICRQFGAEQLALGDLGDLALGPM